MFDRVLYTPSFRARRCMQFLTINKNTIGFLNYETKDQLERKLREAKPGKQMAKNVKQ